MDGAEGRGTDSAEEVDWRKHGTAHLCEVAMQNRMLEESECGENKKDRAEINKIEIKKIENINETKRFSENIKLISLRLGSLRKKERGSKQQNKKDKRRNHNKITHRYNHKRAMDSYLPTNWQPKEMQNFPETYNLL